ncbi:MAG: L-threonylcarbamoyladenylate synthase [Chitinophagales bacterium]|nr:L-threonylcarbamoyladenylate synthase [Chitinophagales bacterium]
MKLGNDLMLAKQCLEMGNLVAIPTETVYGLAANGLDADAVLRIFEAKKRPSFNPLILHVASIEKAKLLVSDFPPLAEILAQAFWPGPLTLVLPKAPQVPDTVTAGQDTVAIRMPSHPLTLALLNMLDFPLAAPSANPSGYISPTTAGHVAEQLGEQLCYILDGGACNVGLESTILKIEHDKAILLRAGGLEVERIEALTGEVAVFQSSEILAPGMLQSHYAPHKQVVVGDISANIPLYPLAEILVLGFQQAHPSIAPNRQLVLSPKGDLHEAARNVFSYLRQLDSMEGKVILAEWVPDIGLGRAINDRLKRAAADR